METFSCFISMLLLLILYCLWIFQHFFKEKSLPILPTISNYFFDSPSVFFKQGKEAFVPKLG